MTESSVQLSGHSPLLREVREDIQGRNLGPGTEAETMDKHHLLN